MILTAWIYLAQGALLIQGQQVNLGPGLTYTLGTRYQEGGFKAGFLAEAQEGGVGPRFLTISQMKPGRGIEEVLNEKNNGFFKVLLNHGSKYLRLESGIAEATATHEGRSKKGFVLVGENTPFVLEDFDEALLLMEYEEVFEENLKAKVEALKVIANQLGEALLEMKAMGYAHLDVKPANVFVRGPPGQTLEQHVTGFLSGTTSIALGDYDKAQRFSSAEPHANDLFKFGQTLFGLAFGSSSNLSPQKVEETMEEFFGLVEDLDPKTRESLLQLKEQIKAAVDLDPAKRRLIRGTSPKLKQKEDSLRLLKALVEQFCRLPGEGK